ncbi:tRNA (adenosine(37)-N6)-threonylcarbamoyltransferase complex ATPase subunit type 1 TsaE [bacterium CG2_30_54_10]|nr:MAG: tRNA (adenosine(37)-N6)-threonylcarbamoyltransferase complex ATPase subunit type 1 TsaE [bacterium CG2_30_54_10]
MSQETGSITVCSPEETFAHGRSLAPRFARSLILLSGQLGAGKTLWAKGFAAGLGLRRPVYSPTFTVMNHYTENGRSLFHLDLYRIQCIEELHDIGLFEILELGIPCLIEWPERVPSLASLPHLRVSLNFPESTECSLVDSRDISWAWFPTGA